MNAILSYPVSGGYADKGYWERKVLSSTLFTLTVWSALESRPFVISNLSNLYSNFELRTIRDGYFTASVRIGVSPTKLLVVAKLKSEIVEGVVAA